VSLLDTSFLSNRQARFLGIIATCRRGMVVYNHLHSKQRFIAYETKVHCIRNKSSLRTKQKFIAYETKFNCVRNKVSLRTKQSFIGYETKFHCVRNKVSLRTKQRFIAYETKVRCVQNKGSLLMKKSTKQSGRQELLPRHVIQRSSKHSSEESHPATLHPCVKPLQASSYVIYPVANITHMCSLNVVTLVVFPAQ